MGADECAPVAQWIEQWFPEPCGGGSSPFRCVQIIRKLHIERLGYMVRRRKRRTFLLSSFCVFIGTVVLSYMPANGKEFYNQLRFTTDNKPVETTEEKAPVIEDEKIEKLTDSTETFDFEGTELLKKNKYPEINELIKDYYDAMFAFDMDGMETLVSDVSRVDINLIRAKLEYMESINNIICYTVDGPSEGTCRVYVYYDLKIKGIETLAPALSAFYVTISSDGNYIIYLNELDADTQEFIDQTDSSEDVKMLSKLVSERFDDVVNSDAQMKNFYDMMQQQSQTQGEAASGQADEASPGAVDAGNG